MLAAVIIGLDLRTWISLVIGALVTILVAYLVYVRQKRPKTLDYAHYELQSLVADEDIFPGLEITVSWAPVESAEDPNTEFLNLQSTQIANYRIQNTGKQAIKADDFQHPITISAPEGQLVDCVVTHVSHSGVIEKGGSVYVSCDGPRPDNSISFTPALLNPGDWLEISVLTDGLDGHLDLSCWIVEETRPMKHRQRILWPSPWQIIRLAVADNDGIKSIVVGAIGAVIALLALLRVTIPF